MVMPNLIRVQLKPSAQARGECVDRRVEWNQMENAPAQGHAVQKRKERKRKENHGMVAGGSEFAGTNSPVNNWMFQN